MTFPLAKGLVRELAAGVETLLVIEELDPFIEDQVKAMGIPCRGKDIFPAYGELLPADIEHYCAEAGLLPKEKVTVKREIAPKDLPGRSPVLCPGCPHRSTFYNLAKMKDLIIVSDIGCYNLGALAPFFATDFMARWAPASAWPTALRSATSRRPARRCSASSATRPSSTTA